MVKNKKTKKRIKSINLRQVPAINAVIAHGGMIFVLLVFLVVVIYTGVIYARYILSTPEQPIQQPLFRQEILNSDLFEKAQTQIREDKERLEEIEAGEYGNPF